MIESIYPTDFGEHPLFPKSSDFEIKVKDGDCGSGVVTHRSFKAGEVIAKMAYNVVSDIRQHTLQISPTKHNYDPYFSGYFLHSCDPNIYLDMKNMLVIALKNIPAESYLYMDYATTEDYLFKQFPCSCDAINCRYWITGKLERPTIEAQKYLEAMNVNPYLYCEYAD